ncbi:MAG: hypothetical protein LBJ91_04350 [Clostridiales Family XIII bacterium]|jgi:hypothetical protein|nr:hypothetical protein [Clostridiales Family XIII bacterium]
MAASMVFGTMRAGNSADNAGVISARGMAASGGGRRELGYRQGVVYARGVSAYRSGGVYYLPNMVHGGGQSKLRYFRSGESEPS